MASRNGSPRVAPAARRNSRRERCFLVMNMAIRISHEFALTIQSVKSVESVAYSQLSFVYLPLIFTPHCLTHSLP